MLQFILRRLGLVIPTFIGITLLTFAFVHMIPGDPVTIMAGERGISAERHAQLMAEMGLDKPLYQQYFSYVSNVLQGDLGTSLKSRISVGISLAGYSMPIFWWGLILIMFFSVGPGLDPGVRAYRPALRHRAENRLHAD
jgi:dipeptide transport system permease protein